LVRIEGEVCIQLIADVIAGADLAADVAEAGV
jgi:hypothetical protein